MPRPPDTSWSFDAVIDFIGAESPSVCSLEPFSPSSSLRDTNVATKATSPTRKPLSLGNFTNLYEKLGIALDVPAPTVGARKPIVDSHILLAAHPSHLQEDSSMQQAEVPHVNLQGSERHDDFIKNEKGLILELDVSRKQISTAEIATPHGQDEAVPSLIDDLGESGDATESPEEELDIANSGRDQTIVEDPFVGMTKKQRQRARKRAEKAKTADDTQQDSEEKKLVTFIQNKLDRAAEETEHAAPVKRQQSRSNVGAKIRPMTPVEVAPSSPVKSKRSPVISILKRRPSAPVETSSAVPVKAKAPVVTDILRREHTKKPIVDSRNQPTLPPDSVPDVGRSPRTPAPVRRAPMSMTPRPSTLKNLTASLSTQYTTAGRSIPYYQQLPPGFVTSSRTNSAFPPVPSTPSLHRPTSPAYHTPVPSQQPVFTPITPRAPQILTLRPREDRHFDFLTKLIAEFPEDKKWLVSPMRLSSDKLSPQGIHVFVDASNILIGFRELLKKSRNPMFDMSFDCLALLLERRRPVAKRVYAGSTRLAGPIASVEKFAELAGEVGYQKDIYEQVYKVREQTESKKFFKDVDRMGWAKATQLRTGSGSDSETGPPPETPSAPKWVEQGVDESLHLKMCQSILDVEVPSTMVLATGDGAAAEYSDGFLAHVERALKKGWKVELVSWKQQTSGGYKKKKFRAKWGDAFRVIELDEYLQWMVDN